MNLRKKQQLFTRMVAKLLDFAHANGYEVVFSYAFRCQDCPVGKENSLHKKCLAIDLELFNMKGVYLTKTSDHTELGRYWESLGGTWGGRFGDGNHYSLMHGGVK